jgi:hypothetical protein
VTVNFWTFFFNSYFSLADVDGIVKCLAFFFFFGLLTLFLSF